LWIVVGRRLLLQPFFDTRFDGVQRIQHGKEFGHQPVGDAYQIFFGHDESVCKKKNKKHCMKTRLQSRSLDDGVIFSSYSIFTSFTRMFLDQQVTIYAQYAGDVIVVFVFRSGRYQFIQPTTPTAQKYNSIIIGFKFIILCHRVVRMRKYKSYGGGGCIFDVKITVQPKHV